MIAPLNPSKFEEKKGILELYTCIQTEGSKAGYPNILVRFSGCTHRCYFGEGGFCDSWYTSWHPEKALFSLKDVFDFIEKNSHICHIMITGGSPTMYPQQVNEIIKFHKRFHGFESHVTIETEGSHFIETSYPIDLVSLSPKFSNSLPIVGTKTPNDIEVTQKMVDLHNRMRLNYEAIGKMLDYHEDYHYKPVWTPGDNKTLDEIETFRLKMKIPKRKTWVMPGGDTPQELMKVYPGVIEMCTEMGYNFTGRPHIIAYGDRRGV